jgi:hypothetical protein
MNARCSDVKDKMWYKRQALFIIQSAQALEDWSMYKVIVLSEISGRGFLGLSQRWHICSFGLLSEPSAASSQEEGGVGVEVRYLPINQQSQ